MSYYLAITEISAADSGVIRLVDAETNIVRANLPQPRGLVEKIVSFAFSSDNTLLAGGLSNGTIIVWRIGDTIEKEAELKHAGAMDSVCFANTSQLIAGLADQTNVVIWNHVTGDRFVLENLATFTWYDTQLCFSHDDSSIIMWNSSNLFLICHISTRQILRTLDEECGHTQIDAMTIHPNKCELVVASSDKEGANLLRFISLVEQRHADPITLVTDSKRQIVVAMCYNQEGNHLAVEVRSHFVVYELFSRSVVAVIAVARPIFRLAFANNHLALQSPVDFRDPLDYYMANPVDVYDIYNPEQPIAHFENAKHFAYAHPCVVLM